MPMNDLVQFWTFGHAFLSGQSPYLTQYTNYYPPAMLILYGLLGMLPVTTAYWLWMATIFIGFGVYFRKYKIHPIWFLFFPVVNSLFIAQMDGLFLGLAAFLPSPWIAGLMMLKPQMGWIFIPWFMARWKRSDWVKFLAFTAALYLVPLIISPNLFREWLEANRTTTSMYQHASVGVYAILGSFQLWMPVLFIPLNLWGVLRSREASIIVQTFTVPVSIGYNTAVLAGIAPAWLMIPISWAFLLISKTFPFNIFLGFTLISAGWIILIFLRKRQTLKEAALELIPSWPV